MLRVMLCSAVHGFCEHQLTAIRLTLVDTSISKVASISSFQKELSSIRSKVKTCLYIIVIGDKKRWEISIKVAELHKRRKKLSTTTLQKSLILKDIRSNLCVASNLAVKMFRKPRKFHIKLANVIIIPA